MDREQLKQFIALYQHHTCLWDVSNKDYTNKHKRVAALQELVPILGENSTLDSVRKRIDILRNSFFREWKKVQASKTTALSPDDVYRPTLFYYNLLIFLSGEEPEEVSRTEANSFDEQATDDKSHLFSLLTQGSSPRKRKKRLSVKSQETENVTKKERNSVEKSEKTVQGDNTFGIYLSQQLQKLSSDQRTLAEKLMSDALFMARTNQLNGTSQIITPLETNYLSDY